MAADTSRLCADLGITAIHTREAACYTHPIRRAQHDKKQKTCSFKPLI